MPTWWEPEALANIAASLDQRRLDLRRRLSRRGPREEVGPVMRAFRRTGLTGSGLTLVLLVAAGLITARYLGGRALFIMGYGGAGILALAYYLGRQRRSLAGVRSSLPRRIAEGRKVDVELEFTARSRVSAVLLEERLHPHLGRPRRISLESIRSGQEVHHSYSITPSLRGVYKVGPLCAVWTDPFGFTQHEVVLAEAEEVIVHPSTENVQDRPLTRQWEDPPIRPPQSKPWPSGFEFYGMRDYVPGDDLRRVVWRATARSGRVMVREFEQGITDRVTLLLDNDPVYHSPGYPSDSFEAAVRTVASLGSRHLKDGFSVTLESNGQRLATGLRGASAQLAFLDLLARVQPGEAPLGTAIERLVADTRRDAHNVIVTPHLDDHAASRLKLLIDRGVHVELVALVWEESDPQTLARAAALGCQVVQLRPRQPLAAVFAGELGGGRR